MTFLSKLIKILSVLEFSLPGRSESGINKSVICKVTGYVGLFFVLASGSQTFAQEGHPFDGTWRGALTNGSDSVPVVIIMDYDGEALQGMINPGRNSFPIKTASLDAPNWTLSVNAESRTGEVINFSGVLMEIGARNRFMEGTWEQGGITYNFKVTRE